MNHAYILNQRNSKVSGTSAGGSGLIDSRKFSSPYENLMSLRESMRKNIQPVQPINNGKTFDFCNDVKLCIFNIYKWYISIF